MVYIYMVYMEWYIKNGQISKGILQSVCKVKLGTRALEMHLFRLGSDTAF